MNNQRDSEAAMQTMFSVYNELEGLGMMGSACY